jgi:Tfp pilus assembly protein PilF
MSSAVVDTRDVRHPPFAERRLLAFCVLEMTRGRGIAQNERAANEWMPGTMTKGWVSGIQQNKLDEAVAEFREAIRIEPRDADAYCALAGALGEQGKLDEVIAEFRAAIKIKPDFAEAHFNLGVALSAQGKREQALAALRKARASAEPGSELAQQIDRLLTTIDDK